MSCCQKCLTISLLISNIVYPLACTAYNFYLVWLLAYLKDNQNYWFLSFVAVGPLCVFIIYGSVFLAEEIENRHRVTTVKSLFKTVVSTASAMVTINLMVSFTMLNRLAYYHVQPDGLIGPRFVIISLQGSIILFLFAFFIQRDFNVDLLLKEKNVVTRVVLDFIDIFNLVQVLSTNRWLGVNGVRIVLSEGSATEMAIQAFCTMSFIVVQIVLMYGSSAVVLYGGDSGAGNLTNTSDSIMLSEAAVPLLSIVLQNVPFVVIRIIIWARYRLHNLGFLMKNVVTIIICSLQLYKILS